MRRATTVILLTWPFAMTILLIHFLFDLPHWIRFGWASAPSVWSEAAVSPPAWERVVVIVAQTMHRTALPLCLVLVAIAFKRLRFAGVLLPMILFITVADEWLWDIFGQILNSHDNSMWFAPDPPTWMPRSPGLLIGSVIVPIFVAVWYFASARRDMDRALAYRRKWYCPNGTCGWGFLVCILLGLAGKLWALYYRLPPVLVKEISRRGALDMWDMMNVYRALIVAFGVMLVVAAAVAFNTLGRSALALRISWVLSISIACRTLLRASWPGGISLTMHSAASTLYAPTILAVAVVYQYVYRAHRRKIAQIMCSSCGYFLAGTQGMHCSECGQRIPRT